MGPEPCGTRTGSGRLIGGDLGDLDLAVEERAAIEQARDTDRPAADRAFARGAAGALQWMLGFTPIRV